VGLSEDEVPGGTGIEVLGRDGDESKGIPGSLLLQVAENISDKHLSQPESRAPARGEAMVLDGGGWEDLDAAGEVAGSMAFK
jgi:hypothetical protein